MSKEYRFGEVRASIYILVVFWSLISVAQSSVLSSGSWYKIGITETGLYKIDRATLDAMGLDVQDPRKISIFGNGIKGTLPQENNEARPVDLLENAIFVSGESDGSFDQDDYILFYGVGPHKVAWTEDGFEFERNFYSDTAYYFLRVSEEDGLRLESKSSASSEPDFIATSFDDHLFYEEDVNNLISTGRVWLGDIISSGSSMDFSFQIEGLASSIAMNLSVVSQSPKEATFAVTAGGNTIDELNVGAVPSGPGSTYSIKARQQAGQLTLPQNETLDLSISYDGNATNARGFIDRYTLTFERALRLYSNETDFRVVGQEGNVVRYEVSGAADATIWNVTSGVRPVDQAFMKQNGKAVFRSQSDEVEEFVVFKGADFPSPFLFGSVPNQDLRGATNFDGLIITPQEFLSEARRLAQFHRAHDQLSVNVVTTREVYNEFSSGRQDVSAIRDYAKHVYESGGSLKYLLLFGDCSFDYKDRIQNNTNRVPTYEARESFHPIFSYSSDDYFAFFEDDEGLWEESFAGDHTMDIGVGRLPVNSIEEAQDVVDKIIYYSTSPKTLGKWRNAITYLADDGDFNIHARHVEDLSELVDTTFSQYTIGKLLLDAYDQTTEGAKDVSPQATAALKTAIKNGTFSVNFIGHGNERLWTEEEVLTRSFINELTNKNKLPIFVTATCEFGRYDDPLQVSGAEELLLSSKGGGIALLTTSRPVFASTNFELNQAFHENIFKKVNGSGQRLGDIIRVTKNEGLAGSVNRNFTLLGDPMMLPAFPSLEVVLENTEAEMDTLSALEEVEFSGFVQKNGMTVENFNGRMIVAVLDVPQDFVTKGQESQPYTYSVRSNALFRGEVEVVDGAFTFSFVVPKNISYQNVRGKMSFYAWDEASNIDAAGSSREFVIGGTVEDVPDDNEAPEIAMYLNDSGFKNGGTVGRSSLFIAELSDASGITAARSGVVEGITLQLDGQRFNLNEFYTASTDGYESGTVVFPLQNLEPGRYTARLKVWDTHNNASEASIEFIVTDEPTLFVFNHRAFPNPVQNQPVTFTFEHDREDEDIDVLLQVFSGRGGVVFQHELAFENSDRAIEILWDGLSESGERLFEGLYYYRLVVRSNFDGATKEIAQKLVIVN
ncbi:MAG: type IX secretion system sortase PorU [Ekhidna sp.]